MSFVKPMESIMKLLSILAVAAFTLSAVAASAKPTSVDGCESLTVHGVWDCR